MPPNKKGHRIVAVAFLFFNVVSLERPEVVLVLNQVSRGLLSSQNALLCTTVDVVQTAVAGVRHFGDVGVEQPQLESISEVLVLRIILRVEPDGVLRISTEHLHQVAVLERTNRLLNTRGVRSKR